MMKAGGQYFASESFNQAQEPFEAAAMVALSDDHLSLQFFISAKRFAVYSKAESHLELSEFEAAHTTVRSLHADLAKITATESAFITAIRSELRAYYLGIETILAVEKGNVSPFRRIASSPEIRSLLREAAGELQETAEIADRSLDDSLPHDLVLLHIDRCIKQINAYPPREIKSWVKQAPSSYSDISWSSLLRSSTDIEAASPSKSGRTQASGTQAVGPYENDDVSKIGSSRFCFRDLAFAPGFDG